MNKADLAIAGLHHVTAIASDPQKNLDFYGGVLGLRLVKRTVNFDDPGTYHFYFGNGTGEPGTIMTFFPWPGAHPGRIGTGQVNVTSFFIPAASLGFWSDRFKANGVSFDASSRRFDEELLSFRDPDGMHIELVAGSEDDSRSPWQDGPVPAPHAIRGFYHVTACVEGFERTAQLLTETLTFRLIAQQENRFRYAAGEGNAGALIDLICRPDAPDARMGAGTVHHIAWRARDAAEQLAWREKLIALGYNVSPVMDRQYFHSIYFREPGGVLFEIATDTPGFATDESVGELGKELKLPSWLERTRSQIEQRLPHVKIP